MSEPVGHEPVQWRTHEQAAASRRLVDEMREHVLAIAAAAQEFRSRVSDGAQKVRQSLAILDAALGSTGTAPLPGLAKPLAGAQHSERRQLASEVERALDSERRQLAQDLHDDLGQTLAALLLRLAPLRADRRADVRRIAAELAELVTAADLATRSLAAQLVPAVLHDEGLLPALRWLAGELQRRFGLAIEIVEDTADKPLSPETASIVYRAVRELLINVAKHAGVDRAELGLRCEGTQLLIDVRDGGHGLRADERQLPGFGLGLEAVRDRMQFLGGSFRIGSPPGGGTLAQLTVPLEPGQLPETAR